MNEEAQKAIEELADHLDNLIATCLKLELQVKDTLNRQSEADAGVATTPTG